MKNKLRFILLTLKMLILIIIVELLSNIGTGIFSELRYAIRLGKYGNQFFTELTLALIIIIVTLLSGNSYVFNEKKENFFKSIVKGTPILILSFVSILFNIINMVENGQGINIINLISLLFFTFSIGLYEEFLCRAWIQNEFIERFSKTRKQIIFSILASSLIFGCMHISNINSGQDIFTTILQIIQATTSGLVLGSVYYRTKNIWTVVFLHAFYDFSIFLGEVNLIKDCTINNNLTHDYISYNIIGTVIIILYFIIASVILLQKSKINNDINEIKNDKKRTILLIPCLIILLFSSIIMNFASGNLNENYTCYHYKEKRITNNETHYYNHDTFSIYYKKNISNIKTENTLPNYNIESYNLKFYYDTNNNITIKNTITNKKILLKYNDITSYIVFENNNDYIILIYTDNGIEQNIYYSNYINKNNISNKDLYLDQIKNSFKKFIVPSISRLGYIINTDNNIKYPLIESEINNNFIIDKESEIYLLK